LYVFLSIVHTFFIDRIFVSLTHEINAYERISSKVNLFYILTNTYNKYTKIKNRLDNVVAFFRVIFFAINISKTNNYHLLKVYNIPKFYSKFSTFIILLKSQKSFVRQILYKSLAGGKTWW
jgi:hypothetical protein